MCIMATCSPSVGKCMDTEDGIGLVVKLVALHQCSHLAWTNALVSIHAVSLLDNECFIMLNADMWPWQMH